MNVFKYSPNCTSVIEESRWHISSKGGAIHSGVAVGSAIDVGSSVAVAANVGAITTLAADVGLIVVVLVPTHAHPENVISTTSPTNKRQPHSRLPYVSNPIFFGKSRPQYRQTIASVRIGSAQNGHAL